ncbi:MAG: patatin-like phospholipase family protein [Halomonas sp.]|nr:patatin-like phospholipase family protein [Halomonas sp.]MCC5902692.1 patatin-like phospholipase family protein [Halomonas sp.]
MGGGVSLGTFSAGAISQVVALLGAYRGAGVDARIDVMSGASAGSMTLGMVLYRLFIGGASDAEIIENLERDLRKAWIDPASVGIHRLMKSHTDPSLISAAVTRDVAKQLIDLNAKLSTPHSLFAEGTLISMALTNLNGFPACAEGQMIGTTGGAGSVFADALQTTYHHDHIRFAVYRQPDDNAREQARIHHARILSPWTHELRKKGGWDAFIEAALASGAFPIAFSPVKLKREPFEYRKCEWPFKETKETGDCIPTRESFEFSYIDGGVTRNEPIHEAIKLAKIRDRDEPDVERLFILIDPHLSGTGENYKLPHTRPEKLAPDGTPIPASPSTQMIQVGSSLMGLLTNQASYREWIRVAGYNRYTEWFEGNEQAIKDLSGTLTADQQQKIQNLLCSFNRLDTEPTSDANEPQCNAYPDPLAQLVKRFLDIDSKRTLRMVAITPNSIREELDQTLLKGAFLANFGGFFDETFRQHDFDVGRKVANLVMHEPLGDGTTILGEPTTLPVEPIRMGDPAHQDYLSIPEHVRHEFDKWVKERALTLIKDTTGRLVKFWINLGDILASLPGRNIRKSLRSALERYEGEDQVDIHIILKNVPPGAKLFNVENEYYPEPQVMVATLRVIRDRHHPPRYYFRFKEGSSNYALHNSPGPLRGQLRVRFARVNNLRNRVRRTPLKQDQVEIPIKGMPSEWFTAAEGMHTPTIIREWSHSKPLSPDNLKSR